MNYKIAILHDWLTQFGGAEKTLEAMIEVFPEADIYTAKFDMKILEASDTLKRSFEQNKIKYPAYTWLSKISKYIFTFFMAPVFENMNMKDYDIVISEGTAWPKGVVTKPNQLHISYIHTPPRFLYGYSTESTKRDKWYFKMIFSYIDNLLRLWDYVAAQRPDFILTNSNETAKRINKFYRREATVLHPPVEIGHNDSAYVANFHELKDKRYYVILGRMARYKNFDKVIDAFNETNLNLVVIGTGQEENNLKKIAGLNVKFLGRLSDDEKHNIIHHAQGAINAVEDEDFGIVPIEVMSHGKPVLAFKAGGHLETIDENVNGMFIESLEKNYLVQKILDFDRAIQAGKYSKEKIIESIQKFRSENFKEGFRTFVLDKYENKSVNT